MFCIKCGNKIEDGEKFCRSCGTSIEPDFNPNFDDGSQHSTDVGQSTNVNNTPNVSSNVNDSNSNSWMNIVSLVIGIICILFVFIFQIFTMPFSLIGIIIGIFSVKNNKKHKAGLILNIISFVIAIPILLVYIFFIRSMVNLLPELESDPVIENNPVIEKSPVIEKNPFIGTWDCSVVDSLYSDTTDYSVTIIFNDKKFEWDKYNDAINNHVIGKYELDLGYEGDYDSEYVNYVITLNGDEVVVDGKVQSEPYKSEYDITMKKDESEALFINNVTYNMYFCYKR